MGFQEQDAALHVRFQKLQFITLDHLDIAPNLHNDVSHLLAQKELQKINHYKVFYLFFGPPCIYISGSEFMRVRWAGQAPRDKMVCILNCCKVSFFYTYVPT